jgi:hypothetical protein
LKALRRAPPRCPPDRHIALKIFVIFVSLCLCERNRLSRVIRPAWERPATAPCSARGPSRLKPLPQASLRDVPARSWGAELDAALGQGVHGAGAGPGSGRRARTGTAKDPWPPRRSRAATTDLRSRLQPEAAAAAAPAKASASGRAAPRTGRRASLVGRSSQIAL